MRKLKFITEEELVGIMGNMNVGSKVEFHARGTDSFWVGTIAEAGGYPIIRRADGLGVRHFNLECLLTDKYWYQITDGTEESEDNSCGV